MKITSKEILLEKEEEILYLIEFNNDSDSVNKTFTVYRVESWTGETGKYLPHDTSIYFRGYLKWDGDVHINFGEEDSDGYVYFAGHKSLLEMGEVLEAVWNMCAKRIKGFYGD